LFVTKALSVLLSCLVRYLHAEMLPAKSMPERAGMQQVSCLGFRMQHSFH